LINGIRIGLNGHGLITLFLVRLCGASVIIAYSKRQ